MNFFFTPQSYIIFLNPQTFFKKKALFFLLFVCGHSKRKDINSNPPQNYQIKSPPQRRAFHAIAEGGGLACCLSPFRALSCYCGRRGIRTPETVTRLPVFETSAIVHSAILPVFIYSYRRFYHLQAGTFLIIICSPFVRSCCDRCILSELQQF